MAFEEYGRLTKALFILRYIEDETMRQRTARSSTRARPCTR
jgi:TnpA family transposase